MDEPVLKQIDYDAADEVLQRYPVEENLRIHQRELLADYHAKFGRSKFRLYFRMREPRSQYEQWQFQRFHGQITDEQLREYMRNHTQRPVDQELIDELFPQLESLLEQYSDALQAAARARSPTCTQQQAMQLEEDISKHLHSAQRRMTLHGRELTSLSNFLNEVRLEAGLGNAIAADNSSSNAMDLVFQVLHDAFEAWRSCQRVARRSQADPRYRDATTAMELLLRDYGPTLPRPQDLLTLLNQEETAARLALRKQATKTSSTVQLVVDTANIHAQNAHVTAGPAAAPPTPKAQQQPVITVAHWSDLAVGIDHNRAFWGISPPLEIGDVFIKGKAERLNVTAPKLRKTLVAFADSANGNSLPIEEIMRVLDRLPPGSNVNSDSRSKPGAIRSELTSELREQVTAARIAVRKTLNDLGRKFRVMVNGPKGKGCSCFELQGNEVVCGFVVRYIFPTANGTSRFGQGSEDGG